MANYVHENIYLARVENQFDACWKEHGGLKYPSIPTGCLVRLGEVGNVRIPPFSFSAEI